MTSQDYRKLSSLLESIKNGSREAFSDVYKMYEKKVYFLFCKLVKSKVEASKLSVELFDYVYLQIANFPDPMDFEKWLYITLFSRAKRHITLNSPEQIEEFADGESEYAKEIEELLAQDSEEMLSFPEGIDISVDMMKTADSVLSELPFRLRFAVLGYYFCGFEFTDISAIEQISVAAVKNRLYRARIKMKTEEHKFTQLGYDCVGLVVFLPDIFSTMAQNIVMAADVAAGVTSRTGIVCTTTDPFAARNRASASQPLSRVVTEPVSKPSRYAVEPPPSSKKNDSISPAVRVVMAVVAILMIIGATVAVVLVIRGSRTDTPQGSVDAAPDTEQQTVMQITLKETTAVFTTDAETTTAEETTTADETTTAEETTTALEITTSANETTTADSDGETTTSGEPAGEENPDFNISVG